MADSPANAVATPTPASAPTSGEAVATAKLDSRKFVAAPMPVLRAPLTPSQIVERLDKASRRGKLAGFRRSDNPTSAFHIEVFGKYFDRRLLVEMSPAASGTTDAAAPSTTLRFDNRVKPLRVWIFWLFILISIWPGVSLTDSILATYFSWYPREFWFTCAWYLPLTILPVPWMWLTAWRQSARVADSEARESIGKIAGHLGASPDSRA